MCNAKLVLFFVVALVVSTSNAILGGQDCTREQSKYHVLVEPSADTIGFGLCGGVMISSMKTITCGHCVADAELVRLTFGSLIRGYTSGDGHITQTLNKSAIIVHENFCKLLILK